MRRFFGGKKKPNKERWEVRAARVGYSFRNTMELLQGWLKREEKTEDKLLLLDFVLDVIREDLKTDILTTILYSEEHFKDDLPGLMFPPRYYDENGVEYEVGEDDEPKKVVDLATDCVLVMPWDRGRMPNVIKNIAKLDFKYYPNNHVARYYSHVDVCYAYNGRHSIGAGVGHKKGEIKAKEINVSKLFDHLHTNGEEWFNSHTGEAYETKVFDFRFAILYEVAKMKHRIK